MEKSLEQTLQPWKLMADTQLREACEAVVKNDTFQEVKNHYTQSGTNYGCVFQLFFWEKVIDILDRKLCCIIIMPYDFGKRR